MMIGTDPRLALDLANQRSVELRAEAERYRRARRSRGYRSRGRPQEAAAQPDGRVYARPVARRPAEEGAAAQ